jgi:hypothetical protein
MITDDPNDPRLKRGPSTEEGMNDVYLVLSEEERSKGFVRPLRRSYTHILCHTSTKMGLALCETYARDPHFYGFTYCYFCNTHFPVIEFNWDEDGMPVGS